MAIGMSNEWSQQGLKGGVFFKVGEIKDNIS